MAQQLVSELPNQRVHAMLALTKMLHFVKIRTTCSGSDERLLLQQTSNPLKRKVELPHPLPADFTDKFIASFSDPITPTTNLMDKQNTGWLVWGDTVDFYAVPPEEGSVFFWDHTSKDALEQLREIILQPGYWDTFIGHLAMEKGVDVSTPRASSPQQWFRQTLTRCEQYLAADVCMLVKSIFQVFEDEPCKFVLPALDDLVADRDNRHKQRAAGELIGGMVRGSKHWSLSKQRALWEWLTPKLPTIFEGMTPETQTSWEM